MEARPIWKPQRPTCRFAPSLLGGLLKDLAEVWQAHGKDTMLHTAKTQPTTFFAVCARLIPSDVKLTVEQTYSGLDPADYAISEPSKKAYQRPILSHRRPF